MTEGAAYQLRLRQYQQAYCKTLSVASAVVKLHETAVQFLKQAQAEENPIQRFSLENKSLRILNVLTAAMHESKTKQGSNRELCDHLLIFYHTSSIAVSQGEYSKAIQAILAILQPFQAESGAGR